MDGCNFQNSLKQFDATRCHVRSKKIFNKNINLIRNLYRNKEIKFYILENAFYHASHSSTKNFSITFQHGWNENVLRYLQIY